MATRLPWTTCNVMSGRVARHTLNLERRRLSFWSFHLNRQKKFKLVKNTKNELARFSSIFCLSHLSKNVSTSCLPINLDRTAF